MGSGAKETPSKEAIELSRSPVRHRQNNIFMNSKSKGALSQNSDDKSNFFSQKSRRPIVTKAKIQAEVDEIDVDNVFTSPNPDMKKSFDISDYFGEKIEKIQILNFGDAKKDSRNLNLSKRLSEEAP
jgi:hypothetical protein